MHNFTSLKFVVFASNSHSPIKLRLVGLDIFLIWSSQLVLENGNSDSRQFSRIFFNCVAEWVKLPLKRLGKSRCDPRDRVSHKRLRDHHHLIDHQQVKRSQAFSRASRGLEVMSAFRDLTCHTKEQFESHKCIEKSTQHNREKNVVEENSAAEYWGQFSVDEIINI